MTRLDRPALAMVLVALVGATVVAVLQPRQIEPLLIPILFVLAGALGPLWAGSRFVCRLLVVLGTAHLVSLAAVAVSARAGAVPLWHALALLVYVLGFAVLVPLAAGYPDGPPPRWSVVIVAVVGLVPIAAVFSGPTPSILTGPGLPATVGPIAAILPPFIARVAALVFVLPPLAAVIAVVRAVRGGRELRGRLVLPLAALVGFALFVAIGVLVPHGPLSTTLFLVSAPLLPIALVAGSRPVSPTPDVVRSTVTATTAELDRLTPREREVLALMAEGHSNPAIGRSLHISLSAVEKHATAIFVKLDLLPEADTHRRVAAVVAYLRAAGGS